MASLTRKDRSPYWFACYTKADGTRTKISTKQTDKRKALTLALQWETIAQKAANGRLTEAQARKVISEIVEQTTGEPLKFYTAADWFREWLAGKEQTKAVGTHERYRHVLDEFKEHLGRKADLNLAQLSVTDLRSFRDAMRKTGRAPKTCNLAVKTISAALNAARRQGFIPQNPAEAIESLKHTAESKHPFTEEQVGSLVSAALGDWRGAILFAYFTGARLQDVANMRWDAIDLEHKAVRFVPQKTRHTGKEVVIPIHPQLEESLLATAGNDNPRAFLFPTLAAKKPGGAHGLSRTFAKIMTTAGITVGEARPRKDEGRAVSRLSFHSLRHSFNSAMANRGVSQEVRMKLTGHATADMNKIYTKHEIEPLRAAVAAIPGLRIRGGDHKGS